MISARSLTQSVGSSVFLYHHQRDVLCAREGSPSPSLTGSLCQASILCLHPFPYRVFLVSLTLTSPRPGHLTLCGSVEHTEGVATLLRGTDIPVFWPWNEPKLSYWYLHRSRISSSPCANNTDGSYYRCMEWPFHGLRTCLPHRRRSTSRSNIHGDANVRSRQGSDILQWACTD